MNKQITSLFLLIFFSTNVSRLKPASEQEKYNSLVAHFDFYKNNYYLDHQNGLNISYDKVAQHYTVTEQLPGKNLARKTYQQNELIDCFEIYMKRNTFTDNKKTLFGKYFKEELKMIKKIATKN